MIPSEVLSQGVEAQLPSGADVGATVLLDGFVQAPVKAGAYLALDDGGVLSIHPSSDGGQYEIYQYDEVYKQVAVQAVVVDELLALSGLRWMSHD